MFLTAVMLFVEPLALLFSFALAFQFLSASVWLWVPSCCGFVGQSKRIPLRYSQVSFGIYFRQAGMILLFFLHGLFQTPSTSQAFWPSVIAELGLAAWPFSGWHFKLLVSSWLLLFLLDICT